MRKANQETRNTAAQAIASLTDRVVHLREVESQAADEKRAISAEIFDYAIVLGFYPGAKFAEDKKRNKAIASAIRAEFGSLFSSVSENRRTVLDMARFSEDQMRRYNALPRTLSDPFIVVYTADPRKA